MTAIPDRSLISRVTTSPINYWGSFVTDGLAAAAFGWLGAKRYHGSLAVGVLLFAGGLLAWTLFEYLIHRWLLHGWPKAAREHAKHHRDARALVATPMVVIPLLSLTIFAGIALAAPLGDAALLTFGIYVGYNYFVIVHHMQHFHPELLARSSMFQRNLRLHELHHRHPDTHFGISCSIWDRAFRSHSLERDQVVVQEPGGES